MQLEYANFLGNKGNMTDSTTPASVPANPPLIPRKKLMAALGSESRWTIIQALAMGEPIGASELGTIIGCTCTAASKHCAILIDAGIITQGRGRLYRIVPQFLPKPGAPRVLDFGHCLIRLDLEPPAS